MSKNNNIILDHNKSKGFEVGVYVYRDNDHKTLSANTLYKIRGVFKYVNKYSYGKCVDTFLTLKNDYGYTIKVNATLFKVHAEPLTIEQRLLRLEGKRILTNQLTKL